jgi:hypothetical protein
MSRKSSKPKTRPIKGGTDTLTGLSISVAGVALKSDTVYDHLSPQGRVFFENNTFAPGGGGWVEIELSKDAVVYTVARKSALMANGSTGDNCTRTVALGNYGYDKRGIFNKGVTTEASQSTYYDYKNSAGSNEYPAEWILVFQGDASQSNDFFTLQRPKFWPDGQVYEYDFVNQTLQTEDTRAEISMFKSGRFYEVGWWTNPFADNLI